MRQGEPLRLKEWRLFRSLSQVDLAVKAGMSETSIVNLEKGSTPRVSTVRKLAEALGIKPGDLYRLPEERDG